MVKTKPFVVHLFIIRNNIESNLTPVVLSFFLIIQWEKKEAVKSCVEIFILVELVEI